MSTDNRVVDMVHHVQVPAEVADGVRTAIEPALKEVAALCAENVRLSNEKWLIERVANTLALENRVLTERVAELEGQEQRADLHANLNRRCADALGLNRPEADVWPSWHDMPERIAALMARVAELGALRKSAHELVGAIQAHECESFDCDRTDERYCDCLKNATDAMASVLARCDGMAKEEG